MKTKVLFYNLFTLGFIFILWIIISFFDAHSVYHQPFLDLFIRKVPIAELIHRFFVSVPLILCVNLYLFFSRRKNKYSNSSEHYEAQLLNYAEDLEETLINLNKYRKSFDSLVDPIIVLDEDLNSSLTNKSFNRFFQIDTLNPENWNIHNLFRDRKLNESLENVLTGLNGKGNFSLEYQYSSGLRDYDLMIRIYPIEEFKRENKSCVIIFQDITEQKLANKSLEQTNKMISLGVLSAGMAHEINNPNNIIMMNASIMKKIIPDLIKTLNLELEADTKFGGFNAENIDEKVYLLLKGILNGSERIKRITDELRNFSRKSVDEKKNLNLNKVVQSSLSFVSSLLKEKKINLEIQSNLDDEFEISGDYHRLGQVFINLLTNACDSCRPSEGSISIKTGINGLYCYVLVKDNGVGIDPTVLDHISDPFFTTKRQSGGMGLGLSITSRIIEEHQGKISFTSQLHGGTEVTVSFPLKDNIL